MHWFQSSALYSSVQQCRLLTHLKSVSLWSRVASHTQWRVTVIAHCASELTFEHNVLELGRERNFAFISDLLRVLSLDIKMKQIRSEQLVLLNTMRFTAASKFTTVTLYVSTQYLNLYKIFLCIVFCCCCKIILFNQILLDISVCWAHLNPTHVHGN